jgi:hypothetical protein
VKILFIGDTVGHPGCTVVREYLHDLQKEYSVDLTILNCENAAGGLGVTPKIADTFFDLGVDVLTSGNHIWDKREIFPYLTKHPRILRPANYPPDNPGGEAWWSNYTRRGGCGHQSARPCFHADHGRSVPGGRQRAGALAGAYQDDLCGYARRSELGKGGDGLVSRWAGVRRHWNPYPTFPPRTKRFCRGAPLIRPMLG